MGREGFEPTQRVALGLQPSPTLQRRRRPESLDSALRFSATGRPVEHGDIAPPARPPSFGPSKVSDPIVPNRPTPSNPFSLLPGLRAVCSVDEFGALHAEWRAGSGVHLLGEAEEVAGGVQEGAVAGVVGAGDGFLDDFGAGGLEALEGAVAVGGSELQATE